MATINDLQELFADKKPYEVAIQIGGFTGFRTTRLEELTQEEINRLWSIHCPNEKELEDGFNALKDELYKKGWKSKILALAERTGIKEKGDFHKFNNWMLVSSVFKKHLNAHSTQELEKLYKQLRAVQSNNVKSAEKPFTKAWWKKGKELKNLN